MLRRKIFFLFAIAVFQFSYVTGRIFFELNHEITRDIKGIFLSLKPPNQMGVV